MRCSQSRDARPLPGPRRREAHSVISGDWDWGRLDLGRTHVGIASLAAQKAQNDFTAYCSRYPYLRYTRTAQTTTFAAPLYSKMSHLKHADVHVGGSLLD